jgi:N-methylhydantoinase A/oxoprolinase/acetone carboxylase beta subunit
VLVPSFPGVTAALGLLATDMVYDNVATVYQSGSKLEASALEETFAELERQARAQLVEDGIPGGSILIQRVADCRYLGQGYELRVDCGPGEIDDAWVAKLRSDFDDIHEREYSRRFEESDVEIPNLRVRGIGLMPKLEAPGAELGPESPETALRHTAGAWFRLAGALTEVETRFYDRAALVPGNRLVGPAIVNQYDSTTVIPPGLSAQIDGFGNILIATGVAEAAVSGASKEVAAT